MVAFLLFLLIYPFSDAPSCVVFCVFVYKVNLLFCVCVVFSLFSLSPSSSLSSFYYSYYLSSFFIILLRFIGVVSVRSSLDLHFMFIVALSASSYH